LRRWRAVSASGVDHEGERKRTTDEASKAYGWLETGVELLPRDEPGGCLLTGQVVSGVKVARAWSGLSWELGNLSPRARGRPVAQAWPAAAGGGENPEQRELRGESSDGGHRGGPSRSSDEGPVMGLERRGRVVLVSLAVDHLRAGGAG
jgi:hypothetical protein